MYRIYIHILAERKTQNKHDEITGLAYTRITTIFKNHHFDTNL